MKTWENLREPTSPHSSRGSSAAPVQHQCSAHRNIWLLEDDCEGRPVTPVSFTGSSPHIKPSLMQPWEFAADAHRHEGLGRLRQVELHTTTQWDGAKTSGAKATKDHRQVRFHGGIFNAARIQGQTIKVERYKNNLSAWNTNNININQKGSAQCKPYTGLNWSSTHSLAPSTVSESTGTQWRSISQWKNESRVCDSNTTCVAASV